MRLGGASAITRVAAAWLAACALVACVNGIDKPPPPDMTALIEAYRSPTGELTAETFPQVEAALNAQLSVLSALCGWKQDALQRTCASAAGCNVCGGLSPLTQAFASVAEGTGGRTLSRKIRGLNGYVTIKHICRGTGLLPTLDEQANGYVELVVGFTDSGFDAVFGGEFVNCRTLSGVDPVTLNANLAFAFETAWFPDDLKGQEPIVRAIGTVDSPEGTLTFAGNIRLSAVSGGNVAFTFEVPEVGSMLFLSGTAGSGIRAANGSFSCTIPDGTVQLECTDPRTRETLP